jgi:uncharacterized iron-regulated protein
MKNLLLIILLLTSVSYTHAQDKPAYIIYNSQGKQVKYKDMLKALGDNDVVFFGELHDNPIAHWLELEVSMDLYSQKKLIMGAEMFEADNQEQLNAFLSGEIDAKGLDSTARLWPNYSTDYAPLVELAARMSSPFIATNIPRRFANLVYKNGFAILDSLPTDQKAWIAPLPIKFDPELPRYKYILEMMGEHGTPELVMAQAIKDATMAHFILQNMKPDHIFMHYNGAYHSDFYEGIMWHLKGAQPDINCGTISTVSQDKITKLDKEHKGRADFIICVQSTMTSTY